MLAITNVLNVDEKAIGKIKNKKYARILRLYLDLHYQHGGKFVFSPYLAPKY